MFTLKSSIESFVKRVLAIPKAGLFHDIAVQLLDVCVVDHSILFLARAYDFATTLDNDLAWNDVDRLGDVNIDLVRHMVCAESIVPYPTVIYEQFFRTYISTLGQSDGLDHLSAAVHAIGLTQNLPLRTIQQLREDPAFFSSDKNDQSRRPLVLDDFHDARSVADTPLLATGEEIATVEESTEENESKAVGQDEIATVEESTEENESKAVGQVG